MSLNSNKRRAIGNDGPDRVAYVRRAPLISPTRTGYRGAVATTPTVRGPMKEEANEILEHFKPFFHAHGGDFEVREVTDDGTVRVHFVGECVLCTLKDKTAEGMEQALKKSVEGITKVEVV